MSKFDDIYSDIIILSGKLSLWTLHEISNGNNTRFGIEAEWRKIFGLRDLMKVISGLMENDFIRPEVDAIGLTRFHVNNKRIAGIAAFISGLGAKPVETRATTCTVETVAKEVKVLESKFLGYD